MQRIPNGADGLSFGKVKKAGSYIKTRYIAAGNSLLGSHQIAQTDIDLCCTRLIGSLFHCELHNIFVHNKFNVELQVQRFADFTH